MVEATRASLLIRLRDAHDTDAWDQFAEVYSPLIFEFGRRGGMQDSDAADLVQEVMREVAGSIKRFDYDPSVGRFRSWLYKIAKRTSGHLRRRQARQPRGTGDSGAVEQLNEVADSRNALEESWNQQYERQLLAWAANKVRDDFQDTTWKAFWMTAVEGEQAANVAERLGISVGSVYVAKNRVIKKLRLKIREIDDSEW
ncbi:MAG: sigma-70 family RNA polymerase sigma factor [Planctomycetota bacterium]